MSEMTGNLIAAMEQYAKIHKSMDKDPQVIASRLSLDTAQDHLDEADSALRVAEKDYCERMIKLEEYIIANVLELGTSTSHAGVEAKHRKGYDRITWSNKALTEICMDNPAILKMIKSTRTITPVDPSVSVNYDPPEPEETPSEETPF